MATANACFRFDDKVRKIHLSPVILSKSCRYQKLLFLFPHTYIGMLVRQTTMCTEPTPTKSGMTVGAWTTQSNAFQVNAKEKRFLKMIMHVKASMERSPR